jgi:CDP-6-deoxy-D-xylo-4-hexulose-3-dehydrase
MKKIWYAPNKFESYGREEILAVQQCLEDGWLAGFGPRTIEFENRIAQYFGKKYGVFVNSGSSACLLALASLQLKKGSKVITPACTFSTTLAPIVQLGLEPLFCDVGLSTYVANIDEILSLITNEVYAIMLPNLIGNKPNWKYLKEELTRIGRDDIVLIEDSADTMTYTKESDISTTSFYASHIITAGGSGGMVMFNSEQLRNISLQFRDWGRIGDNSENMHERFNYNIDGIPYDYKFLYGVLGYNFKSSEMNAAFGLVQLDKFEQFRTTRRKNIERYINNLTGIDNLILPDDSISPNWLAMPLQYDRRLELLHYLEEQNIQTRVTFAGNVTRHPVYRQYLQPFNNADAIMKNGFLLGAHHGMSIDDVDYVCEHIIKFIKIMSRTNSKFCIET